MIRMALTGFAGRRLLAIAVLIVGASLAACEDDPVDGGGHEEGEVASFRIRQVGGPVLYEYPGPTAADADTLHLGDNGSTTIEIVWLDADGDVIELDADDHSWELFENHNAITTFDPSATDAWRGTFVTNDLLAGSVVHGGFTVTLFHGEEEEFDTPTLVATVEGS